MILEKEKKAFKLFQLSWIIVQNRSFRDYIKSMKIV
jgi:hypothetical protein